MFQIKSLWRNVKSRPIIYIILLVTITLCVVATGFFYRIIKQTVALTDFSDNTEFKVGESADRIKLLNNLPDSNIVDVIDFVNYTIEKPIEKTIEKTIDNSSKTVSVHLYRRYTPSDDYFTQDELFSGEKIAIISTEYAQEFNVEIGDFIACGGENLKVVKKVSHYSAAIFVSANIQIDESSLNVSFSNFSVSSMGKLPQEVINIFVSCDFTRGQVKAFNVTTILPAVMGLFVIALASINTFFAYAYLSSRNTPNYMMYKMLGAKNRKIALGMIFETLLLLTLGFFVGTLIDHFIAKPIIGFNLASLSIIDYIYIFLIDLLAVIFTLGAKIFKISRSKVNSSTINGGAK